MTLSTIHKVKGLEWPHVIVHDVSVGIIPHRLSIDIEEERRVFHVAITRAKETLTITSEERALSPFVEEMKNPGSPSQARPRFEIIEDPGPGNVNGGARKRSKKRSRTDPHGLRIVLNVGDEFTRGGADHKVIETLDSGVKASVGRLTTLVEFGSTITVSGVSGTLVAPRQWTPSESVSGSSSTPEPPSTEYELVLASLKNWRLDRSQRDRVPPFVVAHDATLDEIAVRMPVDEDALSEVPGIGERRLELYGDEILATLDEFRS